MALVVIGAGRIGGALRARALERGRPLSLLARADDWRLLDGPAGQPVLVCTRNDDLPAVLARVPAHRHGDLVFVQNGMLRPWLADHGLSAATRGLLFFAVASRGAAIESGPPSPFHGPHAAAVVAELQALEIPASVVPAAEFATLELEKLLWNSVFGLLCQAMRCSVGVALHEHTKLVSGLTLELLEVGEAALQLAVDKPALLQRMYSYSMAIPENRPSVKEWPWRNGWFVAEAARQGRPLAVHRYLMQCAELPPEPA